MSSTKGPAWGSQGLTVTPASPAPPWAFLAATALWALKRVKKLDLLSDSALGGRELVFYVAR